MTNEARLWTSGRSSVVFASVTEFSSWALDTIVERLGLRERCIGSWWTERHARSSSSVGAVAMLWALLDSSIVTRRMSVAMPAFRTQIAVLGVMQISAVGESTSWAFYLRARCASCRADVASLTEVTFVGDHTRVRTVVLRRALVERVFAWHA